MDKQCLDRMEPKVVEQGVEGKVITGKRKLLLSGHDNNQIHARLARTYIIFNEIFEINGLKSIIKLNKKKLE